MKRIVLTDGTGRWFDADKAQHFDESTRWDGHNHISRATGSQWRHEALYRTASGVWVLNAYSQVQGEGESYEQVSIDMAARWLAINGHDELPADVREQFAALEL